MHPWMRISFFSTASVESDNKAYHSSLKMERETSSGKIIFATRRARQGGHTIPRAFAINSCSDAVFNRKVYLIDSHILRNRINRIIARDVCHEAEKERKRESAPHLTILIKTHILATRGNWFVQCIIFHRTELLFVLNILLTNGIPVERKGMKFIVLGRTYDRTDSLALIYFQAVARSQVLTFAFPRDLTYRGLFYLNFIALHTLWDIIIYTLYATFRARRSSSEIFIVFGSLLFVCIRLHSAHLQLVFHPYLISLVPPLRIKIKYSLLSEW